MRLEGLGQLKNPMTSSGLELATATTAPLYRRDGFVKVFMFAGPGQ
jgi:hypothetical protein